MANGETKHILDNEGKWSGRISVTVDHIAHVFDVPTGQKEEDVLSQFWAAYNNHKQYERRVIAANNAKRKKEAAQQRADMIAGVAGMGMDEIAELADSQVPVKMTFEGFAIDDEMAEALQKPVGAKKEEEKKEEDKSPPLAA